ncbi:MULTISPECIES: DUF397 domain-containing protein [unclassified Streptomyces]|uniref:DUF397 domain-containing protein n=1 Tax=unclassified Streptomyces TaxID=2593676 RepID=UPI002ED1CA06
MAAGTHPHRDPESSQNSDGGASTVNPSKTVTAGTPCSGDGVRWHKSSYSGGSGNCVEIALARPGQILVRDSKISGGAVLSFPVAALTAFLTVAVQEEHPPA